MMPICYRPDCTYGPNGGRYSGDAAAVHAHEVTVHGKQLGGRVKGKDIKLTKSEFWSGTYREAR